MKKQTRSALVATLFTSLISLGLSGCAAQTETTAESSAASTQSDLGVKPLAASCTSDCSATGGVAITEGSCTTCSATNASVTCDGVTTKCAPKTTPICVEPPMPTRKCSAGHWSWCGCPDPNDPYPRGWVCGYCQ